MTERDYDQMSLGQLLSHLTDEFGQLVSKEVALVKAEVKEDVRGLGQAGGMLGAAGVLGYLALLLAAFAAAWGLAELMPVGWAFLIVAVVVGIVAAILYATGKRRLDETQVGPERTMRTLKDDVQWAKDQVRQP